MQRRAFLARTAGATTLLAMGPVVAPTLAYGETQTLKISLAQWSLNRRFFGKSREAGFANFFRLLMTNPDKL